jgi:hypothetical protein
MSHFVGFVFGSNVDELLEPYDENMVVDAYVRYTKDEAVDSGMSQLLWAGGV